jgi:Na+/H+-dicarboxylate symporter
LIGRARLVIGVQLLLGTAVLVLAAVGYAGEPGALVVVAVLIVATVGLTQVLPALLAMLLLRLDRTRAGLQVSGIAAFVPGVMIVFLTLTGHPRAEAWVVVAFGSVLAALGFHQLLVRSRLP